MRLRISLLVQEPRCARLPGFACPRCAAGRYAGRDKVGAARVGSGTPAAEVSLLHGTRQGRFASLRNRASPNLDAHRSVRIGQLWASPRGTTTLDQLWTKGAENRQQATDNHRHRRTLVRLRSGPPARRSRSGGQGVAGSNPVSPTIGSSIISPCQLAFQPDADSPSTTLRVGDLGPHWAPPVNMPLRRPALPGGRGADTGWSRQVLVAGHPPQQMQLTARVSHPRQRGMPVAHAGRAR